nr:unnamed protein product [Callosobruchus chinensis]
MSRSPNAPFSRPLQNGTFESTQDKVQLNADSHIDNDNSLLIIHQNVQCLNNKLIELELFLSKLNCDIFCVSEHWANPQQMMSLYIENYVLGSSYCRTVYGHGGTCIYVKSGLEYSDLNYIKDLSIDKQFECSGIKVRTKDYPLVIVSLYRSPEGDFNVFLEKFDALLNLLSLKCKHYKVVICGDFNINFNKNTLALSSLMDILNSYLLKPIIKQPTRSSSCIDNICINVDTLNYNAAVVNNNISDHFAQVLTLYCQKSEQPPKISYQYRDLYNKTNNKHFLTMLSQETWEHIYQASGNVNERFDTFLQTFQYYIDVAFPLKTKIIGRHKVRKPWITKGILVSNDRLHYLYKLSKAGDIFLKDYYRSYKRVYARVLRAAKRLYYNKLIINAKNQTRSAWKVINQNKNSSRQETISLKIEDTLVTEPKDIAHKFMQHFNSFSEIRTSKEEKAADTNSDNLKNRNNKINDMKSYGILLSVELEKVKNAAKSEWIIEH